MIVIIQCNKSPENNRVLKSVKGSSDHFIIYYGTRDVTELGRAEVR